MTILFDSTVARNVIRFGSGLSGFVPFAVTAPGFVEPSDEDKAAAATMFADDTDWDARMAAGIETCEACGRPTEPGELEMGLCCVCMTRAEEATMRSQYAGVGLGWHSY